MAAPPPGFGVRRSRSTKRTISVRSLSRRNLSVPAGPSLDELLLGEVLNSPARVEYSFDEQAAAALSEISDIQSSSDLVDFMRGLCVALGGSAKPLSAAAAGSSVDNDDAAGMRSGKYGAVTKGEWKAKVHELRRLTALISSNMHECFMEDFQREIQILYPLLAAQLHDLRSAVVKSACIAIAAICTHSVTQEDARENERRQKAVMKELPGLPEFVRQPRRVSSAPLDLFAEALLSPLRVTVRVVWTAADAAVRTIISRADVNADMVSILSNHSFGHSESIRLKQMCAQYIYLLLQTRDAKELESYDSHIGVSIQHMLEDSDGKVRSIGRMCSTILAEKCPDLSIEIGKVSAPSKAHRVSARQTLTSALEALGTRAEEALSASPIPSESAPSGPARRNAPKVDLTVAPRSESMATEYAKRLFRQAESLLLRSDWTRLARNVPGIWSIMRLQRHAEESNVAPQSTTIQVSTVRVDFPILNRDMVDVRKRLWNDRRICKKAFGDHLTHAESKIFTDRTQEFLLRSSEHYRFVAARSAYFSTVLARLQDSASASADSSFGKALAFVAHGLRRDGFGVLPEALRDSEPVTLGPSLLVIREARKNEAAAEARLYMNVDMGGWLPARISSSMAVDCAVKTAQCLQAALSDRGAKGTGAPKIGNEVWVTIARHLGRAEPYVR